MATTFPGRGSKGIYYTQKVNLLGGYSISVDGNTEVTSASTWEVSIDANTSIIRMRSDELAYMKYDSEATSSDYDYFIPGNSTLDIYNIVNANTISIIADSANCHVLVSQY